MKNKRKYRAIYFASIAAVSFMFFAYIMGKELGNIANVTTMNTARLIARVNARVAQKELKEPIQIVELLAKHITQKNDNNFEEIKRLIGLNKILNQNLISIHLSIRNNNHPELNSSNEKDKLFIDSILSLNKDKRLTDNLFFSEPYQKQKDKKIYVAIIKKILAKDGTENTILVEIDLAELHNKFVNIESFGYGYVSILSSENNFISHPDETLIGTKYKNKSELILIDSAKKINKELGHEVMSEFLRIQVYRTYQRLKISENQPPWLISVSLPYQEMFTISNKVKVFSLTIGIIASIVLIIMMWITLKRWFLELQLRKQVELQQKESQRINAIREKELMRAQLENLKNQTRPHFLFNSLSSLMVLIEDEPQEAVKFVEKLASLYRFLIEINNTDWADIEKELKSVEDYIYLQKTRFKANLIYNKSVSKKFMPCKMPTSSLLILVENAIKHNIISTKEPLDIFIYAEKKHIFVKNNFNPRTDMQKESIGIGLKNLRERYKLLMNVEPSFFQDDNVFIVKLPLKEK